MTLRLHYLPSMHCCGVTSWCILAWYVIPVFSLILPLLSSPLPEILREKLLLYFSSSKKCFWQRYSYLFAVKSVTTASFLLIQEGKKCDSSYKSLSWASCRFGQLQRHLMYLTGFSVPVGLLLKLKEWKLNESFSVKSNWKVWLHYPHCHLPHLWICSSLREALHDSLN